MSVAVAGNEMYAMDPPVSSNRFLLFLFYVWTFILAARPQDALPFLEPLRPTLLFGVLTFLSLLAIYMRQGIRIHAAGRQTWLYVLFVASLALSVPFGYYPRASTTAFLKYVSAVLFFLSFLAVVDSLDRLMKLMKVVCIGMFFYALYSLISGNAVAGRLAVGGMFDPNDLGYVLVSLLAFNFLFVSAPNHWLVRLICLLNLVVAPVTILMTGSRGGFVALAVVILMLIFGRAVKASHRAVFVGVLLLSMIVAGSAIQFSRFGTLLHPTKDYNYTEETGRLKVWQRGVRIMLTHPLLGVGMDRYAEAIGRDRSYPRQPGRWQSAHNSWIQAGAEAGLFAFVLFGLLNINAYRIFTRMKKKGSPGELQKVVELTRIGFAGQFVGAMFLSQAYSIYWVFYLALSVVLVRLGRGAEGNLSGNA